MFIPYRRQEILLEFNCQYLYCLAIMNNAQSTKISYEPRIFKSLKFGNSKKKKISCYFYVMINNI